MHYLIDYFDKIILYKSRELTMLDVPHTINLYPITKFIIDANPFLEAIPVVTHWSRNMKYG